MGSVGVGLSGFSYREWQGEGRFYPSGLKQREYLSFYSSRYPALEAVGTWRQMPTEVSVARWIEATPPEFRVSPKLHADVTHVARLKPKGHPTLDAFVNALAPVEKVGKLGPVLVQLPPNLKRDDDLLQIFLASLPSLSWAVEFRHESWRSPEVEAMLRARNVAWVAVDTDDHDAEIRDTSDWVYVRLRKLAYTDEALDRWADRLAALATQGKDCVVFCRHTDVEAPWLWADRLMDRTASVGPKA